MTMKFGDVIGQEVKEEVQKEFGKNHHLYNRRKSQMPTKHHRRKGDVTHKISEINKMNLTVNVLDALNNFNIPKAIISVIFAIDEPRKLSEIFEEIQRIKTETFGDKYMGFTAHSLRNHMGAVMKSEVAELIEVTPRGRESARYRVRHGYRDKLTVEEAWKLFNKTTKGYGKKGVKEEKPGQGGKTKKKKDESQAKKDEGMSFSFQGKNGMKIDVNVKIEITINK